MFGGYNGLIRERERMEMEDSVQLSAPIHGAHQPGWLKHCELTALRWGKATVVTEELDDPIVFDLTKDETYSVGTYIDILFGWDDGYHVYKAGKRYRVEHDGRTFLFQSRREMEQFCAELKPAQLEILRTKRYEETNQGGERRSTLRATSLFSKNKATGT